MNPIQIGIKIEEAVRTRPPQLGKRYRILYLNGRVWCHPLGKLMPEYHVVAIFSEQDLKQGFTAEQWDQMARRIYTIIESEERKKQDAETT